MNSIYEKLVTTIEKSKIKIDEDMSKHTSFKTGGKAKIFVKANNINDIKNVIKIAKGYNSSLVILGNGSNILFRDGIFEGIILKMELDEIEIKNKKAIVGAGVKNAILARRIADNSLQGFETISGIPGTIGGAIRMNAGAYGKEMKDLVETVTYIDYNTLEIKTIYNKECNFSYRNSIFCSNKNVIISAILKLSKGDKKEINSKINEYAMYRKEKQPLEYPSAGSTFKRGEDYITSKLIDESGLKGFQIGGAQVSEKHAGFIINKDNATAEDIINLINHVKKVVKEKTGKSIELEIEII